MQIHSLEKVDSTQRYLIDALKGGELSAPCAVTAQEQHAGRGSRGNRWEGKRGNLFVSFALTRELLPDDLRLESCSIYFSFLFKELLCELGSSVWLKWPNDFYLEKVKIGGVITNVNGENIICGIGLNTTKNVENFSVLDIVVEHNALLARYFEKLAKKPSWKNIFSKFELEFENSRAHFTHAENEILSLQKAKLLPDGSIECDGQRIYSLR